jgi:GNAT superfamily N-acetyltransferase
MALWTWWPGDALPALVASDAFTAQPSTDLCRLSSLTGLDHAKVETRLAAGNRCYVASVGTASAAYGWVAAGEAAIGELDIAFRLAGSDRYLWDFQTLPEWRGRGLYPRLLQSILGGEGLANARFWIINAPENRASARGIDKAGFHVVGDLAFAKDGRADLVPTADPVRARVGAALLGVPVIQAPAAGSVSPCWCCVMDALRHHEQAVCWPTGALEGAPCACGRPGPEAASRPPAAPSCKAG